MLRILQLGAIAVVLAVTTHFAFELDRFFVPKELVLHVTAMIAGVFAIRRAQFTRIDWLLAAYLLLGIVSAVLAQNPWLAMRSLAISASGVLFFWAARGRRELINALAVAVVLVAITSLLQTYGVETTLFSENRAPGGTLGNRNFVAHAAAFGLPVLLLATLRVRRFLFGAAGSAIVVASLVLTRSRAAWLAFAAVLLVFLVGMFLRGDRRAWGRFAVTILMIAGGVVAALLIPNALRWHSDNPYRDTLERVASYQEGSGRGRLIQYEHSLRMAARHPILGVGPGNWAVAYPDHAARSDPSMSDTEGGMTTNPWPSSDWIAWVSERGFLAAGLLAVVFAMLALRAVRRLLAAADAEEGLMATALLATIAGAGVAGAFDAVLLLALPALLVWTTLGALDGGQELLPVEPDRRVRPAVIAVVLISALGAMRSAAQLTAMQIYAARSDRASLVRAAQIDPGNFKLRMRLARLGNRRQRCEHARAALALYPNSDGARTVSRGCGP